MNATVTLSEGTAAESSWAVLATEHNDCGACDALAHTAAVYARVMGSTGGRQETEGAGGTHSAHVERAAL